LENENIIWDIIVKVIICGVIVEVLAGVFLERIRHFFSKVKRNEKISINRPPHFQQKLIGRKADMKSLNKMFRNQQCIWISAPGGYGKTTLAIAYAQKYRWRYQKIFWLSWKGSVEKTLTDDINIVHSNEIKSDEKCNSVLYFLREQISKRSLLIIDGLDDYDSFTIQTLKTFNCKVLITSKADSVNHVEYKLDLLKPKECYWLFFEHSHLRPDKRQFSKILDITNRHPLVIKLLARYAYTYSMDKLFQNLINNDIKEIVNAIEIEDGEHNSRIITYLASVYKITYKDNKKEILMNLAVLPSDDIEISLLEELIDRDIEQYLAELEKLGWLLSRTQGTIYLHPMLAMAIQQNIEDEDVQSNVYENMVENIIRLTTISPDDFDDLKNLVFYIPYCESIIKYYKWEDLKLAKLLNNLSCLKYFVYEDKISVQQNGDRAYNILEREYNKNVDDKDIARLFARLLTDISVFYYKDKCEKAIELEERALEIKMKLNDNELDILKSYSNLMLYHHLASHKEYLLTADRIIKDYSKILITYKRTKADFYNHYALMLHLNEKYWDCNQYLEKAKEVLIENEAKEHYMYPMIINSLGASYGYLFMKLTNRNTEEGQEYKKQARKYMYESYNIKKKNLGKPNSSLAISLHNIATIWSEADHNLLAMFYEYRALKIRKEYSEEEIYLASSYLRLGIIFVKLYKNIKVMSRIFKNKGCMYLEEALKIYNGHKGDSADNNSYVYEIDRCNDYMEQFKKKGDNLSS